MIAALVPVVHDVSAYILNQAHMSAVVIQWVAQGIYQVHGVNLTPCLIVFLD